MTRSRKKLKYKSSWRPRGAVKIDARRRRARIRDALSKDVDLPELERSRDRYDPWNWD